MTFPARYASSPAGKHLWSTMLFLKSADPARPRRGNSRMMMRRAVWRMRDVLEAEAADRIARYFAQEREELVQAARDRADSMGLDAPEHPVDARSHGLRELLRQETYRAAVSWAKWRGVEKDEVDDRREEDEDTALALLAGNEAQAWMEAHLARDVQGISETSKKKLALVIAAALAAGLGTVAIAARVDEALASLGETRARSISSNEVGRAVSWMQDLIGTKIEGRTHKQWISMRDDAVRDSHEEADDGNAIPVTEAFEVGDDLMMWPYDASLGAGPENIINCRCFAVYADKGEEI